jgi:hypothetical protein
MAYIKKHTETRLDETVTFWEYFKGNDSYTQGQVYAHFQMAVTERFPDPLTRVRITAWIDEEAFNRFKNDPGISAGLLKSKEYNDKNGITVVDTTDWAE